MRAIRPDVIYARMSGFGHSGPHAEYRSYGPVVQAVCGLSHISGLPGREPSGWGLSYMDNQAAYYNAAFAELHDVVTPYVEPANESIFNQYTIRVERRDELQAFLKERGIGSAIYYPLPLHLQPCFAYLGYKEGQCPEAEKAAKQVLSLPIYPELTPPQLNEVIDAVRAFYGR